MSFILDTHTFIWFINGESLPPGTVQKIKAIDNRCVISIASIWEIAIKTSLGKLFLKSDFNDIADLLHANQIEILPSEF